MAYWLLKTEPDEFSWDDQVKRGAKGEPWTGVRNVIARKNLQAMQKGEQAFFYHTGKEKQIVGIVEIIAGLLVAIAPRIGGWVVCAWLVAIILNLLMLGSYFDIALRDLGLALGAAALARLSMDYSTM